jgi:hypothetical protein
MKARETPKTLFSYLFMVLDYGTTFEYIFAIYTQAFESICFVIEYWPCYKRHI